MSWLRIFPPTKGGFSIWNTLEWVMRGEDRSNPLTIFFFFFLDTDQFFLISLLWLFVFIRPGAIHIFLIGKLIVIVRKNYKKREKKRKFSIQKCYLFYFFCFSRRLFRLLHWSNRLRTLTRNKMLKVSKVFVPAGIRTHGFQSLLNIEPQSARLLLKFVSKTSISF